MFRQGAPEISDKIAVRIRDTVIYHSPVEHWRSECVSADGLLTEMVGSGAFLIHASTNVYINVCTEPSLTLLFPSYFFPWSVPCYYFYVLQSSLISSVAVPDLANSQRNVLPYTQHSDSKISRKSGCYFGIHTMGFFRYPSARDELLENRWSTGLYLLSVPKQLTPGYCSSR